MSETVLTHDAPTNAFADADSDAVSVDDGSVSFDIDDTHLVTVDAPADFSAAFNTDKFLKIEGATVARPIKQTYVDGDETKTYKKPADELRKAAYTADNATYPLTHPSTGVVKSVDDIHGFWRHPRYDDDTDRLKADLYVPHNDDTAREFIADNTDVSVGFYNRVVPVDEYDGDTGDLTDDDGVDGYQTDIFIDHIAGVETGRCPSEAGCGLNTDSHNHGIVTDQTTTFEGSGTNVPEWSEGDVVQWQANPDMVGRVVHVPDDENIVMVELLDEDGEPTGHTLTAGPSDIISNDMVSDDYEIAPLTTDYEGEDDQYFAVAPDENPDDEPKFPINSCEDVGDTWHFAVRERGDIDISFATLKDRIKEKARDLGCDVPSEEEQNNDSCGCGAVAEDENNTETDTDTIMSDGFDLPDLSVDAIAEQHDAVAELRDERDELEETVDEMRDDVVNALDGADNFSVALDEDECPCEAVNDLVAELDEKAERVEELESDLEEYEADVRDEKLDTLGEYLDEDELAEYEDADLDEIESEIDRIESVVEKMDDVDVSTVKGTPSSTTDSTETETSDTGSYGRGYNA